MASYCRGGCDNFKKVPSNLKETKKYCRVCEYFIQTNDLRCKCCNKTYRVNLQKRNIPTGEKIGRPRLVTHAV